MRIIKPYPVPYILLVASMAEVVHRTWPISNWIEARDVTWTMEGCPPTRMNVAYTKEGKYVGDIEFAKFLAGRCIRPELNDPSHSVCSVGYSAPHNKWYGWSHRATCGFGIGDMVFDENFGDDTTPFVKHGSIRIDSMEQARTAACAFARYVS